MATTSAPPSVNPAIEKLRAELGADGAHLSDQEVVHMYRFALAMAGLHMEIIFAANGIPGRTKR